MPIDEPLLVEYGSQESKSPYRVLSFRNILIVGVILVLVVIVIVGVFLAERGKDKIDRLPVGTYTIAGTDVYVVGLSDPVILIMPDINGMSANAKQIADYYAQGGFTVVLVDYFNGDPRTNASDPTWNDRHPANLSLALTNGVIADIKSRGYSNFHVQGYCYGGRIAVSLTFAKSIVSLQSVTVAHPSNLVNEDASMITTPIFFVMPAVDGFNNLAPYFKTTLDDRKIVSLFKTYPNTTHGFAVSGTNPEQKQIAMKDSIDWFQRYDL